MVRGYVSKVLCFDTSSSYEAGQRIGLDPICSLSAEPVVHLGAGIQKSPAP